MEQEGAKGIAKHHLVTKFGGATRSSVQCLFCCSHPVRKATFIEESSSWCDSSSMFIFFSRFHCPCWHPNCLRWPNWLNWLHWLDFNSPGTTGSGWHAQWNKADAANRWLWKQGSMLARPPGHPGQATRDGISIAIWLEKSGRAQMMDWLGQLVYVYIYIIPAWISTIERVNLCLP